MRRREPAYALLLGVLVVWGTANLVAWFALGKTPRPTAMPGTEAPLLVPLRHDECKDGAADVLFTWVNGTDPDHIAAFERASGKQMTAQAMRRFRDYGLLRFAVRSVEKHASWAHRIFFVTSGQVPSWLNISAPQGVVVSHSQIFSQSAQLDGALPTFNSNAIEANLWRVPGLAECFVYLNDDMFFARNTPLELLIDRRSGKLLLDMDGWQAPEVEAAKHNIWHRSVSHSNGLVNSQFHPQQRSVTRHNYAGHCGYMMRSSVLRQMAQWWLGDFEATSRRKWRNPDDTALPFLHHNTALEAGIAAKQKSGFGNSRWYVGGSWTENATNNGDSWRRIETSNAHCVCLQDGFGDAPELVDEQISRLERLLCKMFPNKSSLEKHNDPNPCDKWSRQ